MNHPIKMDDLGLSMAIPILGPPPHMDPIWRPIDATRQRRDKPRVRPCLQPFAATSPGDGMVCT